MNNFQRGMQLGNEFVLKAAIKRRFGSVTNLFKNELGMDEKTLNQMLPSSSKENEMPNFDRRRTGADRCRASDADEGRVEAVLEMLSEMSDEEKQQVIEALSGGDRRRANDDPLPFEGMPRAGGTMVDAIDRWRRPGEDRKHAADRRRFAHDEYLDRHKDGRDDFNRRFPGTAAIKLMG
jgi:hypothetical protein